MINHILRNAITQRWAVLFVVLGLCVLGIWNFFRLPIDAVPDITNVQVQVNTEAPGYSPLEVEQRITFPIETGLAGLPALDFTRSLSRYGLSQVTVVFEEGTDIYFARSLINERLTALRNQIPPGLEPEMGPIATGLGEIFMYTVTAEPGALQSDGRPYDSIALREIQDWIIKPQLMLVDGVTEVNTSGGFEKQYHVTPDPAKLLQWNLTMADVVSALGNNNNNRGAGYIEPGGQQLLIRSPGQLQDMEDIGNVVVAIRGDSPVRVRDVAGIDVGRQLRTGAATRGGEETVLGTAFMLIGENSRTVARDLAARLEEINHALPRGIAAEPVYNRTSLVKATIRTVEENLLGGALLVIAVLFLMLGNLRAALITMVVIPISMLGTFTGMMTFGVSANLMSLGALDFGLIVDGAVIIVENSIRRLALAQKAKGGVLNLQQRLETVYEATNEVIRPSLFGIGVITFVYIPIFALTGIEGKMFHPMAITVILALSTAMVLSFTLVPAALAIFMRGRVAERENKLIGGIKFAYKPLLKISLKFRWPIVAMAVLFVALCINLSGRLGSEFIPQLDEGDIAMHALRIPGTGLNESIAIQRQLENSLLQFPEVRTVFSKIGTPEVATDPMPPGMADTFLILKDREDWPNPEKTKDVLRSELREAVMQIPGSNYEFTQPIEMRFNELISGVRADVGVKVFGDDLARLQTLASEVLAIMQSVPGVSGARIEQISGLPMLTVSPKRHELSRYGINVSELQDLLVTALGGETAGVIFEGDRRFELQVRLPEHLRSDISRLGQLPVPTPAISEGPGYVPLAEVASIERSEAPNQISRENGKRRVVVTSNVVDRDLGSFVAQVQSRVRTELNLPAGYYVQYDGTYQQLESASQRLQLMIPITLLVIFGLLLLAFASFRDALIIFTGVPLALTGGVLALWFQDMPLSISAGVGFIALSGIAVLNGLIMVSFIRRLLDDGQSLQAAIVEGAMTRLRPVLMTALVASLGFIPMALNTSIGAEVQRPLATVVIGGIISSTVLTLFVLPALFRIAHGPKASSA
ncbi:MAG: CusA/CzcA family heavy metal efflux RND transporter [Pseudomonadales bacterium]|nr:CusA/CzcA family heavy metal efflux RND transporter [Pseudomonadales bacterium]